ERFEEARPTRSRLVLLSGREQVSAAAHTYICAVVVTVPVFTRECSLRPGAPGDLELLRGQAVAPLLLGLREVVLRGLGHLLFSFVEPNNPPAWSLVPAGPEKCGQPARRCERLWSRKSTRT